MSNSVKQEASCNDCNSKWSECYSLTGVEIYETGIEDFDLNIENDLSSIENIPEILQAIFDNKSILPTLLGIDGELDRIISEKLKE